MPAPRSAPPAPAAGAVVPQPAEPETFTCQAAPDTKAVAPVDAPTARSAPEHPATRPATSTRRPAAKKVAEPASDSRFPRGRSPYRRAVITFATTHTVSRVVAG
ncbi:hypothetical protein GCM10023097_26920 [Streptomyces collinus]